MVPIIYYFFWVRYHPNKVYFQKKSQLETKYRSHFPPTTKPHPLNPLDHGPTSLVLVGYRLVVLRPLCTCSTIFYFCLLSFPRRFCCSKLVCFVILRVSVLFLQAFPVVCLFYYLLFLSSFIPTSFSL